MSNTYVGFGTAAAFMAARDPDQPINIFVGRKPGKQGKYGLAIDLTILTLSQAKQGRSTTKVSNLEIIYLEVIVDRYQVMAGKIMDDRDHEAIAKQVMTITLQFLHDWNGPAGTPVLHREALLAFPSNLVTLAGEAEYLGYSKETGYTYHKPLGLVELDQDQLQKMADDFNKAGQR